MKRDVQTNQINPVTPMANVVDGAVGVEKRYWFVAIVNNHSYILDLTSLRKLKVEDLMKHILYLLVVLMILAKKL